MHDVCAHPWAYRVEPFRVLGDVYFCGNRNVSSHLLDTGDGLILIDSGFPRTVYLLLDAIYRLGFRPDDIRWIVHTHGHYDHLGGTRALVELTGARTALGAEDIPILTQRPELSWAPEYGVPFCETFAADRPLHHGDVISLGSKAIRCIGTPGHTLGAMSLVWEEHDAGRIYTVGLHGGPGLNTLSIEYLERYGLPLERREMYLRSLAGLRQVHLDVFLGSHPAHNDTLAKRARMAAGANPFIDDQAWPTYLDGLEAKAGRALAPV